MTGNQRFRASGRRAFARGAWRRRRIARGGASGHGAGDFQQRALLFAVERAVRGEQFVFAFVRAGSKVLASSSAPAGTPKVRARASIWSRPGIFVLQPGADGVDARARNRGGEVGDAQAGGLGQQSQSGTDGHVVTP